MKRLISIISLLILVLIFSFSCTSKGLKVEVTEPKPDYNIESLFKDLEDENSNTRANAVRALGNTGVSQAVEPLINALRDEDRFVRQYAATALGQIKDARAVEPLIEVLLKDKNRNVFKNAAKALGNIGEPAVKPLFKALESEDKYVQMRIAMAFGYINNPSTVEFLTDALKDKKLDIIAGAYYFFICRGEEGTETILIEALNKYGVEDMAEDYLNCGNGQLEQAARTWANDHDYTIKEWPFDKNGQLWGSNK